MNHLIVQSIDDLVSRNVIGDIQLRNRCNGFAGELEFNTLVRRRNRTKSTFNGGFFLCNVKSKSIADHPYYFSVVSDEQSKEEYLRLYQSISKLSCSALFLIVYKSSKSFDNWALRSLSGVKDLRVPFPEMELYQYSIANNQFLYLGDSLSPLISKFKRQFEIAKRRVPLEVSRNLFSRLCEAEYCDLVDLYVQRLIFDGHLGINFVRGIPTDIDLILEGLDGLQYLVEVKEKDLSKRSPIGFGMDIRRIQELDYIEKTTGLSVLYVVRQINNQKERKLVDWKCIKLQRFIENTNLEKPVEGGTGMRSRRSSNPTLICPVEYFRSIDR